MLRNQLLRPALGKIMNRFSLDDLKKSKACSELNLINRGIEKECLRIDSSGRISQKNHPEGLGSALTNPYITTDFSEALLELVTPTFNSAKECLDFLTELHVFVNQNLEEESLWPLSMPCTIESEDAIPIGNYGSSNQGMMKETYRKGLSNRYGSMMQAIAGIHYNFSFSDKFLEILAEESSVDIKEFKNNTYLGIARNFRRYGWLYLLLYGSSPLANNSFAKGRDHDLEQLNSDDIYKPHATSLRMGDLGYISEAQDSLNISYNSIEDYCADLKNALETSYPVYKKIGEFNGDERVQLNDSIIQIENEYYSTIRPKRVCPTGERPLNILSQEGIDYLELRCIDLNPNSIIGISEEQVYFLDLLILYCFLQDSPSIDNDESAEIFKNHKIVVNAGRRIDQTITIDSSEVLIKDEALRILNGMDEIAKFMDEVIVSENKNTWLNTLINQKKTLNNLDSSLSGSLLKNIRDHGMSFQEYGMHVSNRHQNEIKNMSPKHAESLIEASKKSLQDARDIESSQQEDFEDYLKEFLDKIS